VAEAIGGAAGARRQRGHHHRVGRRISVGQRRCQGSRLGFPELSGATVARELR
jgi:hypothetical protein